MPEMTSKYDHGVPSWVDIGTPDPKAALAFYSALFDWEGQDMGEEAGHYTICSKKGLMVAALSPAQDSGPPRWTTYVNVEDVEAVAEKVPGAGGTVVVEPMTVMTAGRMAVFSDPTGAFIAAWQPDGHPGAQLVNEAGAYSWGELSTSDLGRAKTFYSEVFGWAWSGADEYAEAQVAGRSVAGAMPRPAETPKEVPDHWLAYFGTDDVEADTARATGLGGTVTVEPREIPGTGRFSVLVDPQGAAFALFQG